MQLQNTFAHFKRLLLFYEKATKIHERTNRLIKTEQGQKTLFSPQLLSRLGQHRPLTALHAEQTLQG